MLGGWKSRSVLVKNIKLNSTKSSKFCGIFLWLWWCSNPSNNSPLWYWVDITIIFWHIFKKKIVSKPFSNISLFHLSHHIACSTHSLNYRFSWGRFLSGLRCARSCAHLLSLWARAHGLTQLVSALAHAMRNEICEGCVPIERRLIHPGSAARTTKTNTC